MQLSCEAQPAIVSPDTTAGPAVQPDARAGLRLAAVRHRPDGARALSFPPVRTLWCPRGGAQIHTPVPHPTDAPWSPAPGLPGTEGDRVVAPASATSAAPGATHEVPAVCSAQGGWARPHGQAMTPRVLLVWAPAPAPHCPRAFEKALRVLRNVDLVSRSHSPVGMNRQGRRAHPGSGPFQKHPGQGL